jgi:hypothetical protein
LQPLSRSIDVREARFFMEAVSQDATGDAHHRLRGFKRGCIGRAIFLE